MPNVENYIQLSDAVVAKLVADAATGWAGEPYTDRDGKKKPGKVQSPFPWAPPADGRVPIVFFVPESGIGARMDTPKGASVYMAGTAIRPMPPNKVKGNATLIG